MPPAADDIFMAMPAQGNSVVATLLRLGVMGKDDWDGALQQILEVASDLLDVERVNFWSFREEPPAIACELGYVRSKRLLERGMVIREESYPAYFAQIRSVQVLAVEDTAVDPRAHSLGGYLETHQIRALLDVPVFAQNRLAGILCHEHVGAPRRWKAHDCELALMLSHTVSGLLEARARNHAEKSERRSAFLAEVSAALAQTLDPARAGELAVRRALPVLGDMSMLIAYDGKRARRVAQAHVKPEEQHLLDELCRTYGGDIAATGLGVQALRERQSLLMPMSDAETLRNFGLSERHIEQFQALRVRSLMSVLLYARDEVTGVITFGSCTHNYDRDDLRFAEAYAQQVGAMLENVRLYAQAQAAIRARDDFLCLAGHELRTPITSLRFAVDLLKKGLGPGLQAVQRAVDIIARQATRLSRLTELIVLSSQQFGGQLPLRFEQLDLAALVRGVAQDFADLLARAGCELRLSADEPLVVRGDRASLEVVISNLLANAMKFGAGTPVEVTVSSTDTSAVVTVRDRGIGIPAERIGSVFERYERAVPPERFGGLGLGLYITSEIVEAHGGTIRADSRQGEGAAFTIELPKNH